MANFRAIAAVTRTLRTLLLDQMEDAAVPVTVAPPDVVVDGFGGRRLNLYLYQVTENGFLRNQDIPNRPQSSPYGTPPLSLEMFYLFTAHGSTDNGADSDLEAQAILGDSMRVMHDFGIVAAEVLRARLPVIGEPILEPELQHEFEKVKITLKNSTLEELSKIWTAMPQANFRRSVTYEVSVAQIESRKRRHFALPVQQRRLSAFVYQRPEITDAFLTPAPGAPEGETRLRPGDSLTIEGHGFNAPHTWVRVGTLQPVGVVPIHDGLIRFVIPDAQYPIDFDHPAVRPVPPDERLAAGFTPVEVLVETTVDVVSGALDRGTSATGTRRVASNGVSIAIVPEVAAINPANSPAAGTIVTVTGQRLYRRGRQSSLIIGDAAIHIREPLAGEFAVPTATSVDVPIDRLAADLPAPPPLGTQYRVRVVADGAESLETGVLFRLMP
jgi:uncharacterized protein DUF4255